MTVGPIANGSTGHKPHEICPWEFCKEGGWTNDSIRAAAVRVKQEYPGMPGICMYGEKDVVEMNQGGTARQRSFEAYTADLMKELKLKICVLTRPQRLRSHAYSRTRRTPPTVRLPECLTLHYSC